jgi:hypothetical protein
MLGIMALAEDDRGDVIQLGLYNQESEERCKASDLVGTGTIVCVKEPWFKIFEDGEYGIRVDHVSDFEVLERDDDRVPAAWKPQSVRLEKAVDVKVRGNAAVGRKDYRKAIAE